MTFERTEAGDFVELSLEGRNPLADQSTDKFVGLEAERAHLHPHRDDNAYPFAYEQTAQLFDSPAAPDLCVLHSAAHNWEDQGGHLGEHGSLGIVQARAPMVIGGKGVRSLGVIPARPGSSTSHPRSRRCSVARPAADGTYLAVQDGEPLLDVLDPVGAAAVTSSGSCSTARTPNVLYDMAARGEAPNVARLIEMGVAFGHGAMSSLPTVTLANHTSIITGAHPGHHGILNNAWFDRAERRAGDHQLAGHVAVEHEPPHARHRVDPRRRAPHVARRVHRFGQRALRHRRRLLDVRLLPAGRGPADPEGSVRAPAHDRAIRAPLEGLFVVVGRRPHGHRPGARHPRRATTAT